MTETLAGLREVAVDDLRRRLVELAEEERLTRSVLSAKLKIERQSQRREQWLRESAGRSGGGGG